MKKKGRFVVYIIDQENATWQGQVTWLDKKETRSFRSMLELIRLMEDAVNEDEEMASVCGHGYVPVSAYPG